MVVVGLSPTTTIKSITEWKAIALASDAYPGWWGFHGSQLA
jgi:hypothetical protein